MNFGYDSLIGISAAFLTTLSFLPQIIKAYRTRRMKDVSKISYDSFYYWFDSLDNLWHNPR